jgi:Gpi18-like mannosyltransferase
MSEFVRWAARNRRFVITTAIAMLWLYGVCWRIIAPDLPEFLFRWFHHIAERGPIGAFAAPFANYTPPYLYLLSAASLLTADPLIAVKSLSILGAICVSLAMARVLRTSDSRYEASLLVFLVPTVAINAAIYGQCDGFWTAACLLAVAAAMDERHGAMLVWYGVAIAFKAQSVFLAPFVAMVLINRRVNPLLWSIPLAIYALAMLPAWLAGWPASDLATIYLLQARYFNTIGTAPNPWAIVAAFAPARPSPWFGIGYAAAIVAVVVYIAAFARRRFDRAELMRAALLSALIVPFLLPKMHERFTLLADLLSFALAYLLHTREAWRICVAVIAASTIATFGAMFDGRLFLFMIAAAAFVEAAAIAMVAAAMLRAPACQPRGTPPPAAPSPPRP